MSDNKQSLGSFWMPFTGNRAFKKNPRLVARSNGMYYYTPDGREILDMVAGMWCCNAGHGHPKIVEAIQAQAAKLATVAPQHANDARGDAAKRIVDFARSLLGFLPGGLGVVTVASTRRATRHWSRGRYSAGRAASRPSLPPQRPRAPGSGLFPPIRERDPSTLR